MAVERKGANRAPVRETTAQPVWRRAAILLPLLLVALVGCPSPGPTADAPMAWDRVPVSVQGRLAADAPADDHVEAPVVGEEEAVVFLHPDVQFWSEHLRHVEAVQEADLVTLRLWFTEEGAERVGDVTQGHVGRRFALLVNGNVISAPEIVRPLRPDPAVPVVVQARLSELEAEQLTDAVARTWPPEQAPPAADADAEEGAEGGGGAANP